MKTFQDYLEMDGNLAFSTAIYNRFSTIGDAAYSEICGGFNEGVYQWIDHNLDWVDECENGKYVGYTINFNSGSKRRVYIEKWVLEIQPKNWKHARALFNKYLKEDYKFNNSEMASCNSYYASH